MEQTSGQCGVQPSVVFLLVTLLVTSAATAMLCAAIMTDHWEYITWDRGKLEIIAKHISNHTANSRHHFELEWLLDAQVNVEGKDFLSGIAQSLLLLTLLVLYCMNIVRRNPTSLTISMQFLKT